MWSNISLIIYSMISLSIFFGEIDVVSSYPDVRTSFSPARIAHQSGADGIQIWNGTSYNVTCIDFSDQCILTMGNYNLETQPMEIRFDDGTSRYKYIYSGRATPEVIDDTKLTFLCKCGSRNKQVNLLVLPRPLTTTTPAPRHGPPICSCNTTPTGTYLTVKGGVPQAPIRGPMDFQSSDSSVISIPVGLFALLMLCIGMMFVVIVVLGAFAWYYKRTLTETINKPQRV